MGHRIPSPARWLGAVAAGLAGLALAGCGASIAPRQPGTTTNPALLPGTGRPVITIGDKNFTEQFILGELYVQALRARGFTVQLNQNIGPLEVTLQELRGGQLTMYPEYLDTWNSDVVHDSGPFSSRHLAYQVAQRYALSHGFHLLSPTPFNDTGALGVTFVYAVQHGLTSIGDLRKVGRGLILGGPPQFEHQAAGLPAVESSYGFTPAHYRSLEIGGQYQALDAGQVDAAEVNTTDAELSTGDYTLLSDPLGVFGWGNVVPVVSAHAMAVEGPAFVQTIDQVSALLTTPVIRELNAAVDLSGQDPSLVATEFLTENGLL